MAHTTHSCTLLLRPAPRASTIRALRSMQVRVGGAGPWSPHTHALGRRETQRAAMQGAERCTRPICGAPRVWPNPLSSHPLSSLFLALHSTGPPPPRRPPRPPQRHGLRDDARRRRRQLQPRPPSFPAPVPPGPPVWTPVRRPGRRGRGRGCRHGHPLRRPRRGRQWPQGLSPVHGRRVEGGPHPRSLPRPAQGGHGAARQLPPQRREAGGRLRLRRVRHPPVRVRHQVQLGHGVALLFRAHRGRGGGGDRPVDPVHDADRGPLRDMRRAPGARLPGRAPPDGAAVLHERGGAGV